MRNSYFSSIIPLFFVLQLFGAASSSSMSTRVTVIAVGGQNTLGSEVDYVGFLFSFFSVKRAQIPQGWLPNSRDLGQHVCMEHLARDFPSSGDVIFHATSQGTATVLNFVSGLSEADQARVKAIVLEAALASGNDAIIHTTSKLMLGSKPILSSCIETEGCYYALPYCARPLFPRYSPSGIQPIKSIENIIHDIPIVIIHSKEDKCLPYSGACALYYGLRAQGHENVYFISLEGEKHIRLLEEAFLGHSCYREREHLAAILAHHNVFGDGRKSAAAGSFDKSAFQPEIEQYREMYERLCSREQNHTYIPPMIGAVAVCSACLIAKPEIADCCTEQSVDMCGALLRWFTTH